MSESVEVVLNLERIRSAQQEPDGLPTGVVDGVEVVGHGKRTRRRLGRVLRVVTELPLPVALNVLDFHRTHTSRSWGRYNCLSFMATSQGWGVGEDEFFLDEGPDLVAGRYSEVEDISRLKSGTPYGLPDDNSRLVHGIVGLPEENRHLDVFGSGAEMRYARTTDTLAAYLGHYVQSSRLVQLEPGSYRSSEVIPITVPVLS